jgi:hypothetical protein
MQGLMTLAP